MASIGRVYRRSAAGFEPVTHALKRSLTDGRPKRLKCRIGGTKRYNHLSGVARKKDKFRNLEQRRRTPCQLFLDERSHRDCVNSCLLKSWGHGTAAKANTHLMPTRRFL